MSTKHELEVLGDDIAALEKAGLMDVKPLALRALTRVYRLLREEDIRLQNCERRVGLR